MIKTKLKNGGLVEIADNKTPADEEIFSVNTADEIEFLPVLFEALEEIAASSDKRLTAIGKTFKYLVDKYGKIKLTPEIVRLMDELQASPDVPSFTKEKADKIKKVKAGKIKKVKD